MRNAEASCDTPGDTHPRNTDWCTRFAGCDSPGRPGWHAVEAEAIRAIQAYVRINTPNPPGDVTNARPSFPQGGEVD